MIRKLFWIIIILFLVFPACKRKKAGKPAVKQSEVKQIEKTLNIKIKRYEQTLKNIPQENLGAGLKSLQTEYYCFIGDSIDLNSVEQIKDYLNHKTNKLLYAEVEKQYPDLSSMEKEFGNAFSLLKYHFPEAVIPQIYTYIDGLTFQQPSIIFYDSTLIIALDMYLGRDFKLYKRLGAEIPKFIIQRFSREYILADCFKQISYNYMKYNNTQGTLLDEMIMEGKRLLFTEAMLPEAADSVIFPFPQEKIEWITQNQANVWGYLIEKKYLYSKDNAVVRKWISESPFTSFFGNQSPGRLGVWIGWQICRSWVEKNPNRPISELLNELDAQKILTESKYKPKK
jgi:hypothetical protein